MIYISATRSGRAGCAVLAGPVADGVTMSRSEPDARSVELDGITWQPMFHVVVPEPGEYELLCSYEGDVTFGVGTALGPDLSPALRLLLFGCTGALAAVLGSRLGRRSHRRRH